MKLSPARLAAGAVLALCLRVEAAPAPPPGPKAIEPQQVIKSPDGYFEEVFGIDGGAQRLAVIRTDGATFAKLETVEVATGKTVTSLDLPSKLVSVEQLVLLPEGKGVIVIGREGPGESPVLTATLIDAAGRVAARIGPATAFGRPPEPELLIAFDRKAGEHGVMTYTITPYHLTTLAPAGKPRVYQTTAGGELKAPPFRVVGFLDGYARAVGERPGAYDKKKDVRAPARRAVLDTLTGKLSDEEEIRDVMDWALTARLRADHPDRAVFAALNQDQAGVDIVDPMGKKLPAELIIPFRLYDPKSLQDQEGPERGAFYFSLSVDTLNPDAVKRKRPDLPMLDLYAADVAKGKCKLRGRIFVPRPVTWRAGYDKLVVLKRFKSFTRGGDEIQIFNLR
jgi:hypothetical protein